MTKSKIRYITCHCSDSDIESHGDISVIAKWHSERGWVGPDKINGNEDDVGYSYFIKNCGSIQKGREEGERLAHAKGHNVGHIAICLHGRNEFSEAQELSLANLIQSIMDRHDIERIYYHNELDPKKTCPNYKYFFIDEINIRLMNKRDYANKEISISEKDFDEIWGTSIDGNALRDRVKKAMGF